MRRERKRLGRWARRKRWRRRRRGEIRGGKNNGRYSIILGVWQVMKSHGRKEEKQNGWGKEIWVGSWVRV